MADALRLQRVSWFAHSKLRVSNFQVRTLETERDTAVALVEFKPLGWPQLAVLVNLHVAFLLFPPPDLILLPRVSSPLLVVLVDHAPPNERTISGRFSIPGFGSTGGSSVLEQLSTLEEVESERAVDLSEATAGHKGQGESVPALAEALVTGEDLPPTPPPAYNRLR